jgi:type IV pilus biogenesis protein CpaD/CtpE
MNRIVSSVLAAAAIVLASGCASDPSHDQAHAVADAGYTPIGTLIPRKAPSREDNVTIVDKQSLENDRTNGNGTNNWAASKN